MARLRHRSLQVTLSLFLAAVLSLLYVAPAGAADAPAPPSVSSSDWAKWKAQLSSRTQAARMPLRAIASKIGSTTNSVTAARARAAVVAKSVAESRAKSNAAFGRVAVPTTAKNVATKVGGKVLGGAGKAMTGVFVFNLTYELGTSAMDGMFGLESEGFMCDVGNVFGQGSCAVGAAEGYVANGDVGVFHPPGWTADPVYPATWQYCNKNGSGGCAGGDVKTEFLIVDLLNVPQVGTPGTVTVTLSGIANPHDGWSRTNATTYGLHAVSATGAQVGSLRLANSTLVPPAAPPTLEPGSLYAGWDHLVLRYLGEKNGYVEVARWYPPGHPQRPVDVIANPIRHWQTTWQCSIGGGATITESAVSAQFSELDETWPEFPDAACSSGDLVEFHVDQISEGMEPLRVYEWVLPEEAAAWAAEYPQCADGSCTLELERLDQTTGAWLACFDSPDLCTNWFADPAKTENYRCTYGGDTLALDECTMYAPTFTKELGGGLGDPLTGEKVDTSKTGPGTAPTDPAITKPGTSLWGTNERPGNCPPPFEWNSVMNLWWYYQGIKCALVEVFVPAEPAAPFIALADHWATTRVGGMFASWTGIFDVLRVGAPDCRGPGGRIPDSVGYGMGGTEFYPINACTGWAKEWAPRVKGVLTWYMGLGFAYNMLEALAAGFGYSMGNRPREDS